MNPTLRLGAASVLLMAACIAAHGTEQSAVTALVDVHVVTLEGETILRDHGVLVRGQRIVEVAPRDQLAIPKDAQIISGRGGYVIPGLIDLHVHVAEPTDFPLYLANGVTTVRNAGGHDSHLAWREQIRTGRLSGPTLYTCGPQVFDLETVEAAQQLAAEHAEAGWDCVKVYDRVNADAWRALTTAGRRRGLQVSGHIPRNLTWQDMLAAGPDSIDHAEEFLYSPLSGDDLPRIAERMREHGTAIITTLTTYDTIGRQVADLDSLLARREMGFTSPIERRVRTAKYNSYLARFDLERVPRLRELLVTQKRILRRLHDDGVRLLVGTDAGPGLVLPGYSIHDELAQLVDVGLTPLEALRAATVLAGEFLGAPNDLGRVKSGQIADLVVLMGNPLEDISNTSLIAGVMSRGQWHGRRELSARVEALRSVFEPEERMIALYEREGLGAAIQHLEALIDSGAPMPVRERTLNEFGYQLRLIEDRPQDALAVFELVTRVWPESWNAWDSLAECLEASGDTDQAQLAYARSVKLKGVPR